MEWDFVFYFNTLVKNQVIVKQLRLINIQQIYFE